MADKTYLVNTPIMRNGTRVEAGELVDLGDKIAAPLVECKAVTEQLANDAAPKKSGK